mmetsp:Transcript_58669/g.124519  ORF Transcript_58669/g.124519 Transcript_58669/m.124519 type:complete len:281 (-) Transcript_58669:1172-2014(-)
MRHLILPGRFRGGIFESNERRRKVDSDGRYRKRGSILLRRVGRIPTQSPRGRRIFRSVALAETEAVKCSCRGGVHRLLLIFVPINSIFHDIDRLPAGGAPASAGEVLSGQGAREDAREFQLVGLGIVRPGRVVLLQSLSARGVQPPLLDVVLVQFRPWGGGGDCTFHFSGRLFRRRRLRNVLFRRFAAASRKTGVRFSRFSVASLPRRWRLVMPRSRGQRRPIREGFSRDIKDFFLLVANAVVNAWHSPLSVFGTRRRRRRGGPLHEAAARDVFEFVVLL